MQVKLTWPARLRALATTIALALSAGAVTAQVAGCPMPSTPTPGLVTTGMPVVEIWTNGYASILDRENYLPGCVRITNGSLASYTTGGGMQAFSTGLYTGALEIRGRGNSTWDMPKRGYRLKLPRPGFQMLDMPLERDWVLLANYADKTLMRAAVGFELSKRLGMAWTPKMRYVELYLNGDFLGNYLLGEHVKVAPNRVNVAAMAAIDVAPPNVTGGYLVEADFLEYTDPTDIVTYTSSGILFNVKAPSPINDSQKGYISGYLQEVENRLLANNFDPINGYAQLIDANTFIDWWIVKELVKDVDSPFYSSVYLYKDRNGKLKMGPLWDFDLSSGNVDYSTAADPTGWRIQVKSEWFLHLFKDKAFRTRVYDRWKAVKAAHLDTLPAFIDQTSLMINASQRENFRRWDILDVYVWPNNVVLGSHQAEVDYLKNWLTTRTKWIDKNLKR